jgi:hypothetical protein
MMVDELEGTMEKPTKRDINKRKANTTIHEVYKGLTINQSWGILDVCRFCLFGVQLPSYNSPHSVLFLAGR